MSTPFNPMDTDYHRAIAAYEAKVASGQITFDESGFADSYEGEQASDAALGAFVASHVPMGM
jgi:hypothetical protein